MWTHGQDMWTHSFIGLLHVDTMYRCYLTIPVVLLPSTCIILVILYRMVSHAPPNENVAKRRKLPMCFELVEVPCRQLQFGLLLRFRCR